MTAWTDVARDDGDDPRDGPLHTLPVSQETTTGDSRRIYFTASHTSPRALRAVRLRGSLTVEDKEPVSPADRSVTQCV
jgi:hypothetical protein